ncbi:MAG: hypothetical protein HY077_16620 [Elusimicrobia bacterium]|nr:hypothetical protein [Elusimicrobiota bacterium]
MPLACLALAALSASAGASGVGGVAVDTAAVAAYRNVHTGFFDLELNDAPSPALVELGRRLFFDKRLSRDRSLSCSVCHRPDKAWSDGLPRARGRGGAELDRNAPSLLNFNRNISRNFFWDGRAQTMEDALLTAIQSPREMNQSLPDLISALRRDAVYARRFGEIWGPEGLNPGNAAKAITAFVRAEARTGPSPFDRFRDDPSALSSSQQEGLKLFVGKAGCLACHAGPFFSADNYHNNGLKPAAGLDDPGRYAIEQDPVYWRAFKTPPLRNVAVTAPYMHDGRFKTLREVVDFYDRGGDDPDGDSRIKPLRLTAKEKTELTDFLAALTGPQKPVAAPAPESYP